ncbi:unnamed protein product [Macrosiphum euphorbiae]|uniref:Uncharacterized protein n=1 Tax=Macrosiphum euphorbiae TaxID=13131 RepID=A0AAV0XC98_9HEMI|nr:unnamed protein product [Macrosiphum euphorbiae]
MRVPAYVRVEFRVAGVPVRGHLRARLQGVQRGHRDGAANVPDNQLDGVQQLRVGVMRRMVSDETVGQLSAVPGHGPAKRHRNRGRELHTAHERFMSAGKFPKLYTYAVAGVGFLFRFFLFTARDRVVVFLDPV